MHKNLIKYHSQCVQKRESYTKSAQKKKRESYTKSAHNYSEVHKNLEAIEKVHKELIKYHLPKCTKSLKANLKVHKNLIILK